MKQNSPHYHGSLKIPQKTRLLLPQAMLDNIAVVVAMLVMVLLAIIIVTFKVLYTG